MMRTDDQMMHAPKRREKDVVRNGVIILHRPIPMHPEQHVNLDVSTEPWFNDEFVEKWDLNDKMKRKIEQKQTEQKQSNPIPQSPTQYHGSKQNGDENAESLIYAQEHLDFIKRLYVEFWMDLTHIERGLCTNITCAMHNLISQGCKCISECEHMCRFVTIFELTVRGMRYDKIVGYLGEIRDSLQCELEHLSPNYDVQTC